MRLMVPGTTKIQSWWPGWTTLILSIAKSTRTRGRPDYGMPVTTDYGGATSKFNGKIDLVQIDLGDDSHDHLIDPAEIIRIAMSRQ